MIGRLLPQRIDERDALPRLGRASASALGPVIRLLSWNIFKARRPGFASDFETLTHDRDLVLLQESVLNAPSDRLFVDGGRLEWVMARSFREARTRREHGVKTGATAPAIASSSWRSPHAEPLSRTRKMLLATRYPIAAPGLAATQTLLVLNMHAINFVSADKYRRHLEQLAGALDGHAGPLILAGDFNTWNLQRRDSFFGVTREARLNEAPLARRARVAQMSMHLDHVMYRGLNLRLAASLEHVRSSDHAPITATFDCPPPP